MGFDIKKIKVKFMIKYPDFSHILERLEIVIDPKESTAATDGEKLYFSPEYMSQLTEEQQLFVFAHEVLHVAFDHIDRSEGKNHYNWNIATDAVINAYLSSEGLEQPPHTVDIIGALNYYAEQIYERLQRQDEEKKKKEEEEAPGKKEDKRGSGKEVKTNGGDSNKNDKNDKKDKNDGQSQGNDNENDKKDKNDGQSQGNDNENNKKDNVGHDSHSKWEEAAKKHRKEREERGENPNPPSDINEKEIFENNKKRRQRDNDNYLNGNDTNSPPSTSPTGNGTRGRTSGFDEVNASEIDWRRLLKESVDSDYDWDTSDLEEEDGVIYPVFKPQKKAKTEIVIDTSGSISETLIKNFLKECMSIINTSETDVGFFDDYFYGFERVNDENDIENLEIQGGGGTNFDIAVSAFSNRAENKIIFTDGMCSAPKEYCDAIWVVVGYSKHPINPPGGKVIYITGEAYEALNTPRYSRRR